MGLSSPWTKKKSMSEVSAKKYNKEQAKHLSSLLNDIECLQSLPAPAILAAELTQTYPP